jgi:lysophospholipase L1-like esterase
MRLTSILVLLAGLIPIASGPATAQLQILAFGDSITNGEGFDDPGRTEYGYPPRLENLLAREGLTYDVVNAGLGGEDTTQGITRLDGVLEGLTAGEILLLMEGTNDVAREVSLETIRFDLDEMARKAAERGLVTVHATVIPRRPDAKKDPNNVVTKQLDDVIRNLAADTGRVLCDQWNVFTSEPNYWPRLYYTETDELGHTDPVGHPNAEGFDVLAQGWLPKVLKARERPLVWIQGEAELATGATQHYTLGVQGTIARVKWELGDDGLAWSSTGPDYSIDYMFLAPGTYEVKVTAWDVAGRISENRKTVVVTGEAAETVSGGSFLQSLILGPRGGDGVYESSLWLHNAGPDLALSELFYYPRGAAIEQPARRVVPVRPGETVSVENLLADAFGETETTGSLGLRYHVLAATGHLPAVAAMSNSFVSLGTPEEGNFGQLVPEETEPGWTSGEKVVNGILSGDGFITTLLAANLGGANGRVDVTLTDAAGAPVGDTAALTLGAYNMRFQRLTSLFPEVSGRTGPFTARFRSNGIRFAASATLLESVSEDQIFVPGRPQPTSTDLYLPRVVRGAGQFGTQLTSELALFNDSTAPTDLSIGLLLRGQENPSPQLADLTLAPGEARVVGDVILDLFARDEATGALTIAWTNSEGRAPYVHAYGLATAAATDKRTGGRFGMLVPAVDETAAITGAAEVFGVAQTPLDKTSYGVINLSAQSTQLRVSLRDAAGVELGTADLTLRARQHLERNIVGIFSGLGEGTNWTLHTQVLAGGPVLSYMARINVSGDVFFVPARPLGE